MSYVDDKNKMSLHRNNSTNILVSYVGDKNELPLHRSNLTNIPVSYIDDKINYHPQQVTSLQFN
jgi:hypothetical protein